MVAFDIRLLGGVVLRVDGEVVPLTARKQTLLLAYLALHHEREVRRDTLASLLWPDSDDSQGRFYLRKALSQLRQLLGPAGERLLSPTPGTLRLDFATEGAYCDVLAFDAATTPPERLLAYGGPLLPEFDDAWVMEEREKRETLYQAAWEAARTRRNLPVPLTELVGRADELRDVTGWLERRRLVTLLGPGGAGKTRLAIAAADTAQERFPDGVWFVDLAPLTDPAAVPRAALRALRLTESAGQSAGDKLRETLTAKNLLLVLDNTEHVLEATAALALDLLTGCAGVRLLVTSRQALGLTGEQVYPLAPLDLPPAEEADPNNLLEYSAVRLFVERATQANPTFRLGRTNRADVVRICRSLDGMPLALEMAASRVRSRPVDQIAGQIAERLDTLTAANRAVPTRQQSLRATMEWSYDLLNDDERALWRAISVFSGGWTRDAAEALLFNASEILPGLVEKSVVLYRPLTDREDERFLQLQMLKEFGATRSPDDREREEFRARHLDYYRRWCVSLTPRLDGPDAPAEFDRMEEEHDNIRDALRFGRDSADPERQRTALALAREIARFCLLRGYARESREWLESLLALPGTQEPTLTRAKALMSLGNALTVLGDHRSAEARYQESLRVSRPFGDDEFTGRLLTNLGANLGNRDRHAEALTCYEEAAAILRPLPVPAALIPVIYNIAVSSLELGQYERCGDAAHEALSLARATGDRMVAAIFNVLSDVSERQGDLAAAHSYAHESLAAARQVGDRRMTAEGLARIGHLFVHSGDLADARRYLGESLHHAHAYGNLRQSVVALGTLARLEALEGKSARAATLWGLRSALRESAGLPADETEAEALRSALGDAAFASALQRGKNLTLADLLDGLDSGLLP